MPTVIAPSTEDEMIATFLRAELGSSRFRELLHHSLEQHGFALDLIESPDSTDEVANRMRREVLITFRGWEKEESVFGGLPTDRIEWAWVDLEECDLRNRVFYIQYFWEEFSGGTRRPSDVAEDVRRRDAEVSTDLLNMILNDIRSGHMPPEPILLAEPEMKRLVILEGHMRITAYLVDPSVVSFPLRVLVGMSPDIGQWSEW